MQSNICSSTLPFSSTCEVGLQLVIVVQDTGKTVCHVVMTAGFYGFNPGTMGQLIAADGSSYAMVSLLAYIRTSVITSL